MSGCCVAFSKPCRVSAHARLKALASGGGVFVPAGRALARSLSRGRAGGGAQ